MLTPDEQDAVTQALAQRLAIVDLVPFVVAALPPHDVDVLRTRPGELSTADQKAAFLIDYCLDSRWTFTPSLLELTLSALITAGVEVAPLAPLRDRVRQKVDPNPNPSGALWLDADMPFFSRPGLRPLVDSLLTADAQPILQIVGPASGGIACGKTYTYELIDHVGRSTRSKVHVAAERLPEGFEASYTVEELADALIAPTGKDLSTRPPRAGSSFPRTLCRWILNAAVGVPGKWIYVLDGFNQQDVQAEVRALVEALAVEIAGGVYRQRIRLVLIDYDAELPSVQAAKVLREEVPAATAVTEADIFACLAAHYDDLLLRRGKPKPSPHELDTVARTLIATAPPGPERRLETLNTRLHRLRRDDLRQP